MNYAEMSDFEINSAVHNAKLSDPYSLVFMGDDRIAWTKENGDQIITDRVPYTKNGVHDYCNNPADAWPIIVENGISLVKARSWWVSAATGFGYEGFFGDDDSCYYGRSTWFECGNPLRAAMVVFLMMKEGEGK